MPRTVRSYSQLVVWHGALLFAACNSGRFGASNSGQPKTPAAETSGPKGASDDQTIVDKGGRIFPSIENMKAEVQCLQKRADVYNFLILFDTSGSTEDSDPMNVRRTGATKFAERMGKLAALGPKPLMQVATLGFNKLATVGLHGWVKLGTEKAIPDLGEDILTLTSTTGSGTHFDVGLGQANRTIGEKSPKIDSRVRSYVIIMSDGKANGDVDELADVQALWRPSIDSQGVATYSIAAGEDLNDDGMGFMEGLALPKTGVVAPDHVGKYYAAPTDQAVEAAWDDLYKLITTCDMGKP